MNNAVFGKTMENVRNHRGIKLITTETRRNYLVLEPKYHTKKFVSDNLLATEIEKTPMIITKPVYSGLTILEISKIVLFQFWYDYVKAKYGERAKLSYRDTDSFTVYIKTEDIDVDIATSFGNGFDTSH